MVKCLPAMWETWVRSLGWEGPLEKDTATHFSTLAWKISWTEECDRLQSMGLQRVRHDWATSLSLSFLLDFPFFGHTVACSVVGKNEFWLNDWSASLRLTFFFAFLIIIIHNDLPQVTLTLCLKRLIYPLLEVGHCRRYLQDNGLYFLKFSPSLSYKRSWHPDPDKMAILRHYSFTFLVIWLSE